MSPKNLRRPKILKRVGNLRIVKNQMNRLSRPSRLRIVNK